MRSILTRVNYILIKVTLLISIYLFRLNKVDLKNDISLQIEVIFQIPRGLWQ